jgi:DNA polymerase III epsilon subunit-like protein
MPSIAALDIETTGLDANKDAIIEIGVVRFNETRIGQD